jgi:hypothetical protein
VSEVGPAGPARPRRVPPAPGRRRCSSALVRGPPQRKRRRHGRDDRNRRRSIVVGRMGQGLEARFIEIGTGFAYAAALRVPKPRGLSTSPHLHFALILYGRLAQIAIWRADYNSGSRSVSDWEYDPFTIN